VEPACLFTFPYHIKNPGAIILTEKIWLDEADELWVFFTLIQTFSFMVKG